MDGELEKGLDEGLDKGTGEDLAAGVDPSGTGGVRVSAGQDATGDQYSFELPPNFMDDLRSSVTDAMGQVNDMLQALPSPPTPSEILAAAQLLPGVPIARDAYLREVLARRPAAVREAAILTTPRAAGVSAREIARLARRQQGREARRTTALSFAAGFVGGPAAAATIPADLAQFYGHLMRMIQMLSYLYGWRDTCAIEPDGMSEATRRAYLLFIGVGAGDELADALLERLGPLRAHDAVRAALAQDEAIGEVEAHLAERMARRLSGQVVGKSIPVAGAIISLSIGYGGFSDMCGRLRKQLERIG